MRMLCEDAMCEDVMCEDAMCEDVMCEDAMCEDAMCEDAMCEDRVFLCRCANMDDKIWALIPCAWLSLTMNNC